MIGDEIRHPTLCAHNSEQATINHTEPRGLVAAIRAAFTRAVWHKVTQEPENQEVRRGADQESCRSEGDRASLSPLGPAAKAREFRPLGTMSADVD